MSIQKCLLLVHMELIETRVIYIKDSDLSTMYRQTKWLLLKLSEFLFFR